MDNAVKLLKIYLYNHNIMNAKYNADISPYANATASFQSVKGNPTSVVDVNSLVADSVSPPNEDNQLIFKNLPLSWWVSGLNSGNIQYRPLSNYVNWAFVNLDGKDVNISMEITEVIIPNNCKSMTQDSDNKISTLIMEDNNCLVMSINMPIYYPVPNLQVPNLQE